MSKEQTNNVIYISHLLPDEEMQELLKSSELGVESIEFSISDIPAGETAGNLLNLW